MTPGDFEQFLRVAKKYNVERFKVGDCEVHMPPRVEPTKLSDDDKMPTEDQMLFHSSIPLTDDEIKARPPA
jgi:hypothetical protein